MCRIEGIRLEGKDSVDCLNRTMGKRSYDSGAFGEIGGEFVKTPSKILVQSFAGACNIQNITNAAEVPADGEENRFSKVE